MILRLAVLILQYGLTDGRMDGQKHDDSIYRASIASRGKKGVSQTHTHTQTHSYKAKSGIRMSQTLLEYLLYSNILLQLRSYSETAGLIRCRIA